MNEVSLLKSYGRLRGRNFDITKLADLEKFSVRPEILGNSNKEIVLEIGFGYGEHLIQRALEAPDKIFIGSEVYENGICKLLGEIKNRGLSNVFIWSLDVRILLQRLKKQIFNTVYILFPDPWPKKRHNKRRIVNRPFLGLLLENLHPSGELIVATDNKDYAEQIHCTAMQVFSEVEFIAIPGDITRYASKATEKLIAYRISKPIT
ncbi:tRNA (guanine-N(7)-)-methyltransferase [Neorickettsia helminthoeca str. Oregon]|uniref:tRNA (guanine-N(7)-)-methyltransferase n=1 Tax=Neorickettsia helminthoeca str. Oregon TaxID=1286528 RepID=X5H528_9RICK|nr:tRNA (guanosine(46)-N7)-methyltransferase TrmB [Neorickettsia helminthoeca]AHX11798.1 tRNA (guanine-N(7)-)-methyltransferase [Neorickettsia helminthoeca str. Oregon]